MRNRHDLVLLCISLGLLLLAAVTFLLAVLGLLGDVLAFELMGLAGIYIVPLAMLLAVVAWIVREADRRIEQRFKK
jgi:hypothetical protein